MIFSAERKKAAVVGLTTFAISVPTLAVGSMITTRNHEQNVQECYGDTECIDAVKTNEASNMAPFIAAPLLLVIGGCAIEARNREKQAAL